MENKNYFDPRELVLGKEPTREIKKGYHITYKDNEDDVMCKSKFIPVFNINNCNMAMAAINQFNQTVPDKFIIGMLFAEI